MITGTHSVNEKITAVSDELKSLVTSKFIQTLFACFLTCAFYFWVNYCRFRATLRLFLFPHVRLFKQRTVSLPISQPERLVQ